jgi:hypothetical protein
MEMNIRQERLKLEGNIAAVFLGAYVAGHEVTGGALVIPAGEVIRFDRTTPLISRMLPIEWRGTKFGVPGNSTQMRKHNLATKTTDRLRRPVFLILAYPAFDRG